MAVASFYRFGGLVTICDGCGEPVDANHMRRRIERLELATRFRPIHINVLLIDAAPPVRREDFLYDLRAPLRERSAAGQWHVRELAKLAGSSNDADTQLESILAELQHRGYFLASAVECPMSDEKNLVAAIRRLAATVVRRVQTSYRPKYLALLGDETRELIEPLRSAGWTDRLILDNGAPFAVPVPVGSAGEASQNRATPSPSLSDRLLCAVAHSS